MHALFAASTLRVEQPPGVPSARSKYTILDGAGVLLARAAEERVPVRRQAFRALFGDAGGAPRTVQVTGVDGAPLFVIAKPKGAAGAVVLDPAGAVIGDLRRGRRTFVYSLHDGAGRVVGELAGNRLGRRFAVTDHAGVEVAQIDKKWAGLGKEVLTTADRYTVDLRRPMHGPLHVLVIAAALAIDLMHYEEKDFTP
ncbi:phospholipid scramblase-related protein [Actinomadura fibrosa]|uniref:Phospholipid scramblase-related protein n=1 Tax=Actinomadura fibrosa TaxID=111802 RepID=A0ABW2XYE4_9ACTN